jgi:hypothetical protein
MSRSEYSDDCDGPELALYRGAVQSAINGKRGQALLREMLAAFDAMPVKALVPNEFEVTGQFCALGVVGHARGLDMAGLDNYGPKTVANRFGIAKALAAEIMFENDDEWCTGETPEGRWFRMRAWVEAQLKTPNVEAERLP